MAPPLKKLQPDLIDRCVIPLGRHAFTLVDPADFDELNKYYWRRKRSHSNFYAARRTCVNGKSRTIFMHRQIMHAPSSHQVHHKNGNTLDNRRCNLELLTHRQHQIITAAARVRKQIERKTREPPQTYSDYM